MSSNLPPGVTERMLPGNTPEDEAYEAFLEELLARLDADDMSLPDGLTDQQTRIAEIASDIGFNRGYAAGSADAGLSALMEGRGPADVERSAVVRTLRGLLNEYKAGHAGAAAIAAVGEAIRRVEGTDETW